MGSLGYVNVDVFNLIYYQRLTLKIRNIIIRIKSFSCQSFSQHRTSVTIIRTLSVRTMNPPILLYIRSKGFLIRRSVLFYVLPIPLKLVNRTKTNETCSFGRDIATRTEITLRDNNA